MGSESVYVSHLISPLPPLRFRSPVSFNLSQLGADAGKAILNVNTRQAAQGTVAFALALPIGASFAAGHHDLISASFQPLKDGSSTLLLTDQPVLNEIANANADALSAIYVNGNLAISSRISLRATVAHQSITLTWPAAAQPMILQETGELPSVWSNRTEQPIVINGQNTITLPLTNNIRFFRLFSQGSSPPPP